MMTVLKRMIGKAVHMQEVRDRKVDLPFVIQIEGIIHFFQSRRSHGGDSIEIRYAQSTDL